MSSNRLISAVAALAFAALPAAPARAADVTVSGLVGSSLSLTVPTPNAMTLTPGQTATTTSAVAVVTTLPSWTMTIADANTGAGAGHLRRGGDFLANPLQWNVNGGGYADLTGSPVTVTTGNLAGTPLVGFRQVVGASEPLSMGDTWSLTASIVVS